jgi:predicted TIM-barrel enzyme
MAEPSVTEQRRQRRRELVSRLGDRVAAGHPIIGAGAGTGISAKFEERGGADLILVYNSGKYRMAGLPSTAGMIAIGDANEIVMELGAREILPVVEDTPVIAGVLGADPTRVMPRFLEEVAAAGFAGVINFPTHGVFDGAFRRSIEAAQLGYAKEIEMIETAGSIGLLTVAYVFGPEDAKGMVAAGADLIVAHLGRTVGGTVGAIGAPDLDRAVVVVEEIRAASGETPVLCHGGPLAEPADVEYVLSRTGAVGFVGASSIERLPVEAAIESRVRAFGSLSLRSPRSAG